MTITPIHLTRQTRTWVPIAGHALAIDAVAYRFSDRSR